MALKISVNVIFYIAFIFLSLFYFIQSAPVDSSISYENFMNDIKINNCSFPAGVILPFQSNQTFEYLALPLEICKTSEEPKNKQEARTLCSEVFDTLKNITCHPDKRQNLPEIRIDFSDDVCQNISSLKSDPSLNNTSLLKHLTDKFICDILCADAFLPACRVLLWSHQVQNLVEYLPRVQNLETPNKEIETTDVHEEKTHSEYTKTKVLETTLAEKSSPAVEENNPAIKNEIRKPDKDSEIEDSAQISNTESLNRKVKPDVKNVGEENKLDDIKNSAQKSTIDQQSEKPTKTNNSLKSTDHIDVIKPSSPEIKASIEPKADEKPSGQVQHFNDKNEVSTKNKNNTVALNVVKIKSTTKSIDIMDKKIIPSSKIAGSQEAEQIPKKELHTVEEVKNSTKINKIEESHSTKNEEKDDTQPAIVPKITNEADEDKAEHVITQNEDDLNSEALPTVGNNEKTTIANANLEKMEDDNGIPEPGDKEQDSYNLENDREYSKLDYEDEDGFDEFSKNKKTNGDDNRVPNPADISNELPKYDGFPARSIVGQGADDLPVISTFPEQEDSHFFFYFLSLMLILMGGYLLFHNKQKIIALIVEGRHERRRRSHGIGYKKLETK